MRFNLALMGIALAAYAASAQAQQMASDQAPTSLVGAAAMAKSDPSQTPTAAPTATSAPTPAGPVAGASGNGAPTLSDLARQGVANPAPRAETQPTQQVPAIEILDSKSKVGPKTNALIERPPAIERISLSRISRVGFDTTVVLWVEGQNRRVTTGSRVLEYTIGEIREDGVCMYKSKSKTKDRCKPFLTLNKGI